MITVADVMHAQLVKACARAIDDDMIRFAPEIDPQRHAELVAQDESDRREAEEHRRTCPCPYCSR